MKYLMAGTVDDGLLDEVMVYVKRAAVDGPMTVDSVAEALGCEPAQAREALTELLDKGDLVMKNGAVVAPDVEPQAVSMADALGEAEADFSDDFGEVPGAGSEQDAWEAAMQEGARAAATAPASAGANVLEQVIALGLRMRVRVEADVEINSAGEGVVLKVHRVIGPTQ